VCESPTLFFFSSPYKTLITTIPQGEQQIHIDMDRDSLPRVPDTHGDVVDEKLFSDLYIRTSWVDAQVALDQIDKVSDKRCDINSQPRSKDPTHL